MKSVLPILSSYLEVWQIVAIVILLVIGVGALCVFTSIHRRIRSLKVFSPGFIYSSYSSVFLCSNICRCRQGNAYQEV